MIMQEDYIYIIRTNPIKIVSANIYRNKFCLIMILGVLSVLSKNVYGNEKYAYSNYLINIDSHVGEFSVWEYPILFDLPCDYTEEPTYERCRGKMVHLIDNFYTVSSPKPGNQSLKSLKLHYSKRSDLNDSIYVRVKFNEGNKQHKILVYENNRLVTPIQTLSPDSVCALSPYAESLLLIIMSPGPNTSPIGTNYCIKFLELPTVDGYMIRRGELLTIELEDYSDSIFEEWYVDGEIIRLSKDKLEWNGTIFERIF